MLAWGVALSNLATAALVAALSVPLVRGRVPPNRWYGVRLRRSFESEAAWYLHNRHGGRVLLRWSAVVAAAGVLALTLPPSTPEVVWLALGFAPLLYLLGVVQILRFARRSPVP